MAKEKLNESCRLVQQDPGNADLFASEIFTVKYCSEMSRAEESFFFFNQRLGFSGLIWVIIT